MDDPYSVESCSYRRSINFVFRNISNIILDIRHFFDCNLKEGAVALLDETLVTSDLGIINKDRKILTGNGVHFQNLNKSIEGGI